MLGTGTENDPYIIQNVTDLQNMNNDLDAWYELEGDIDASDTLGWNGGDGFIPVGTFGSEFTGHFDGRNFRILDLYIDRAATNRVGLFGNAEGPTIQNVGIVGGSIVGKDYTGALVGELSENLAGWPTVVPFTINNCYSMVPVTGEAGTGGLIGEISHIYEPCEIKYCYATGTVTNVDASSASEAGGLIGSAFVSTSDLSIYECYATGAVTCANGDAGGLCGKTGGAVVRNCYAKGVVSASPSGDDAGGLIATIGSGGLIDKCYSTGLVSAGGTVGGLIATGAGEITNCVWDTETSGQSSSQGGVGKTTAEMKEQATFQRYGWDFTMPWGIISTCNGGYPCLLNVTPSCAMVVPEAKTTNLDDIVTLEAIRNLEMMNMGRAYINELGKLAWENRFNRFK